MAARGRVFVTGASGFLGTALVERLLAGGYQVVVLVHQTTAGLPRSVVRVEGSLADRELLLRGMAGCEAVFHLAALVSFAPALRNKLLEINRDGTHLLLECARAAGVKKAVVTGSACTLGVRGQPLVVDEEEPCRPEWRAHNVYLDSKRAQEEVCFEYHVQGLEVVVVLPTTVFGPGDRLLNSGIFFKQVSRQRAVIVPPGGTSVVDVEDVAQGHLAALEHGRSGERYILTAENLTFSQVYETIVAEVAVPARLIRLPRWSRAGLTAAARAYCLAQRMRGREEWQLTPQIVGDAYGYKWYSPAKAGVELGWRPRFSFSQTVQRALAFYRREKLL